MKSVKINRLLLSLFLCVFILSIPSCFTPPEKESPAYFKKKNRDPKLMGTWRTVSSDLDAIDNGTDYVELKFQDSAELHVRHYGAYSSTHKEYWYTDGDKLYQLRLGDGFKVSNTVTIFEYRLENNDSELFMRGAGSLYCTWDGPYYRVM